MLFILIIYFSYLFIYHVLKSLSHFPQISQESSGPADMADTHWKRRSLDLALLTFLLLLILRPEARYSADWMLFTSPSPFPFLSSQCCFDPGDLL